METKRKKILYVITKSNFGGAQRYVYDLATSYAGTHDIVVALGGQGNLAKLLMERHIRIVQIPHLSRDISFKDELRSFWFLLKLYRDEKPDIVHVNSSKAAGLGALAARLVRVPYIVFTAHGWAFNEDRPFFMKIVIAILHWLTVLLSHTTIAVSHSIYEQMARAPFTTKKMHIIPLGIAEEESLEREEARKALEEMAGASLPRFVIGTIAELHPIKDYPTALRGFSLFQKDHPESAYVIIGEGTEKASLHMLANKEGVASHTHFLGFVPNAARYMRAFDVFVLTSRSEALGYVILEAGRAGVPIIATRVGGIPEIISSPEYGTLIPPGEYPALAEALSTLYENPRQSISRISMLQERIRSAFSISRMRDATTALYETRA